MHLKLYLKINQQYISLQKIVPYSSSIKNNFFYNFILKSLSSYVSRKKTLKLYPLKNQPCY